MQYRYQNVCLESIAYTLPEEVVTSAEIEARLAPLYRRLRLPEGPAGTDDGHRPAAFLAAGHAAEPKSAETAERRCGRPASTVGTSAPWSTAPSAATSSSRPPPAASITGSACRPNVPSTTSRTPAWDCSTAWSRWPT